MMCIVVSPNITSQLVKWHSMSLKPILAARDQTTKGPTFNHCLMYQIPMPPAAGGGNTRGPTWLFQADPCWAPWVKARSGFRPVGQGPGMPVPGEVSCFLVFLLLMERFFGTALSLAPCLGPIYFGRLYQGKVVSDSIAYRITWKINPLHCHVSQSSFTE